MTGSPRFVTPPGVAWTEGSDVWGRTLVYVAPLPHGPVSVLPDQSAAIWLAAVEGRGDVVEEVAEMTGNDADEVRDDVDAFVTELIDRGLLRKV